MGTVGKMEIALGADTKKLKKGMQDSQNIIQGTMDAISNMKAELVSIGSVAGPIAALKSWAGAVNDLEDATGMAAESASKLLAVGEFVGLTTEDMSTSLNKMAKTAMQAAVSIDTASASGGVSSDVFTRFGISILDTNGKLLSSEQIFDNVAAKHRSLANGVEKTALEMAIFGRSGAKLNDLLNMTTDELDDVKNMAQKMGLVMSHDTSQGVEDATFQMNAAQMAVKGFAVSIGAQMLPEINKLISTIKEASANFNGLSDEEKRHIAVALEVVAAVSALSIGWRGLVFLSAPFLAALGNITAAYKGLSIAAMSASAAIGIGAAVIGGTNALLMTQDLPGADATQSAYDALGVSPDKQDVEGINSAVMGRDGQSAAGMGDFRTQTESISTEDLAKLKAERAAEEARKAYQSTIDFSGTGGGGGSSGSGGSDKSAEQAVKEISEINKQITELQAKVPELTSGWVKLNEEIKLAGLSGSAEVIAGIEKESVTRQQSVDDWLEKVKSATAEAEQIRQRAAESGDAEALASATALYEERKNAEILATQEAEAAKQEIFAQSQAKMLENATMMEALKAEMQEAMRQGDLERYMAALSDERVAFMTDMEERQALMQAYYDWRMEAEETFTTFAIDAANQLKQSLGQAAANVLVYGASFSKVMKDMIKSIAAMYIQWAVEKMAASALSKTIMKQESATVAAQGAAMAASLAPAAWAKLVLSPGSAAIATGLLTTGMAGASAIGAAIGGLGGTVGTSVPKMANGGIVTAPTLALIGEAGDEAVIPLSKMGDMFGGTGGQVVATQNIYGDINTGADSDDLFNDFSSLVMSGLRGA